MWGAGLKMRGKTANPSQGLDPHVKQGASQFLEKNESKMRRIMPLDIHQQDPTRLSGGYHQQEMGSWVKEKETVYMLYM